MAAPRSSPASTASPPSATAAAHAAPTLDWCTRLPKIELHAHIHGSIRPATLEQILRDDAAASGSAVPRALPATRTLDACFEMFGLIHEVVVSRAVLHRITVEAVEDFARAGVKYLELRSTPRALERDGASRADYVAEVVAALDECHAREDLDIQVRLLLSINRNQPLAVAEETLGLALEWRRKSTLVVGLDLSGHSERPNSEFRRFEHLLEQARAGSLKLALHFAEHFDDDESERILTFRPDRLGHACCLSDAQYRKMVALRIPIEVCLTSNVYTLARFRDSCKCSLKDASGLCIHEYAAHPHACVLKGDTGHLNGVCYPLCICTDDQGVLDTTLPSEYMRAVDAFGLDKARVVELAAAAIPTIFDAGERERLRELLVAFQENEAVVEP